MYKMIWLCKCLNAMDVTNIGEQHDLMPFVKKIEIELEQDKTERSKEVDKGDTMDNWKDLIEKEKKDHTLSKESNERDSKTKQNQKTDR